MDLDAEFDIRLREKLQEVFGEDSLIRINYNSISIEHLESINLEETSKEKDVELVKQIRNISRPYLKVPGLYGISIRKNGVGRYRYAFNLEEDGYLGNVFLASESLDKDQGWILK